MSVQTSVAGLHIGVDDVCRDVVIFITGRSRTVGDPHDKHRALTSASKLQPYALFHNDAIVGSISKDRMRAYRPTVSGI